jgi:hypothetical protein
VILLDTAWSGMIPRGYRAVLVGLAIKGTLVYLLAHFLARHARSLSAERRHSLWLAVLLMLVALPAAQFLVPVVHLPVGEVLPWLAASIEIPQPPAASSPLNSLRVWEATSRVVVGATGGRFDAWITLALAGIWAVGTLLILSRLAVGRVAFAKMLRSDKVEPVPASRYRALARLAGAAAVRVVAHPRAEIPFAFGILRPTIVVPGRWSSWTEERLNIVLMHELAHVKRRDAIHWQMAGRGGQRLVQDPRNWCGRRDHVQVCLPSKTEQVGDRSGAGGRSGGQFRPGELSREARSDGRQLPNLLSHQGIGQAERSIALRPAGRTSADSRSSPRGSKRRFAGSDALQEAPHGGRDGLTPHEGGRTLSPEEEKRMAEVDPIQALRDLTQKRFIELATEMQPKTRRLLKELFDGVVSQLSVLRDAVEDLKHK